MVDRNDVLPTVTEQTEPLLQSNKNELPRMVAMTAFTHGHQRNHSAADVRIEMSELKQPLRSMEMRKFSDSQLGSRVDVMTDKKDTTVIVKKKLSESRNVQLSKIEVPRPTQFDQCGVIVPRESQVSASPLTQVLNNSSVSPISSYTQNDILHMRVFLPSVTRADGVTPDFEGDLAGYKLEIEGGRRARADYVVKLLSQNHEFSSTAFTLWMVSPLLEVQLKPHHVPYEVHQNWRSVVDRFASDEDEETREADQPLLCLKRSVLLNHVEEMGVSVMCEHTLPLMFIDAKNALMSGRYSLSPENAAIVAGYGFAVECGKYDENKYTADFVRRKIETQLPEHLADHIRGPMVFGKTFSSSRLLEAIVDRWKLACIDAERDYQQKVVTSTNGELMRQYLRVLRTEAPQYGAAFFRGSVERPSISSLKDVTRFIRSFTSGDDCVKVTVGINREFITVVDDDSHEMLLVQKIAHCTWKKIEGSNSDESERDSVLLLHFPEEELSMSQLKKKQKRSEDGAKVKTNLLQIFGPQVVLMDSMLNSMRALEKEEEIGSKSEQPSASSSLGRSASSVTSRDSSPPSGRISVARTPSLTKCNRLCLASFENGKCIRANGSLKKVDWNKMQSVH